MNTQTPRSDKLLIVSMHDVTPRHWSRLKQLDDVLHASGIGDRYSMLVVPDFWHDGIISLDASFCAWLKAKADAGVEMVLHGFFHRDDTPHRSHLTRWKAGNLTAYEGEFLGLPRKEIYTRLVSGKKMLEEIVERPITAFVAPAWLYSRSTLDVLKELGFDIAENQFSVWSPARSVVLSRAPVVSYASRSAARTRASLAWSRISTHVLQPFHTVRVALHPHDLDVPDLVREASRVIRTFAKGRTATSYSALATRLQ